MGKKEIRAAIREANEFYVRFGETMLADARIMELLEKYRNAIAETQEKMKQSGVVRTCTICAVEEKGGCCFNGVEEWYDALLLFINLLMGVRLPDSREIPKGCLFVGENGCRLIARFHFCINYLCHKLKDRLDPSQRKKLMAVAGREILCGIELENTIRNILTSATESNS